MRFKDARLGRRYAKLLKRMGNAMGESIPLVCHALEDQGVSQDFEVRLQSRGRETQNRATPGKPDFGFLHAELAGIVDDDDEPCHAERIPQTGVDRNGNYASRQSCKRPGQKPGRTKSTAPPLPHQNRRLGGYLVCASDPPPGNKVIWKGLSRLTDIELGAIIGARLVGN
jgi:Transposase DNA-binding